MKKLVLLGCFLTTSLFSLAQELYNNAEKSKQETFSKELNSQFKLNYAKSLSLAKEKNWTLNRDLKNGKRITLQGVDSTGHPLYLSTYSNAKASNATRTSTLYTGGSLGLNLSGSSDIIKDKLGVWDGGAVLATHLEMVNRVAQQDAVTTTNLHSTHVAGTMIASGVSAQAKGMSFGANLKAWDYSNDLSEMSTASPNLLISNHSYGYLAGWGYDDTNSRWVWYGNTAISDTEDYKFGFYDTNTQNLDKLAYNAPYYLVVKAAGNSRGETGPEDGESYYLNETGKTSTVVRSHNDGYDVISLSSNAKNILTVAAVNALATAPLSSATIKTSSFSSWGPTDDGRVKPDIAGIGVNLFSTSNSSTSSYATLSGTSMASPQVAGSLLLLQELYAQTNKNQLMRASTLKGLVLHTADDAGNAGPDYIYGWGLLNMEKAAKVILNKDKSYLLTENTLTTGKSISQDVVASGKEPLVATICWTDPAGTATTVSKANLNNRTPKLVNDLDIRITDTKTTTYLPFVLNPDTPSAVATKGDNSRDNVEQIIIPNVVPGQTYTITVSHKNTLTNASQVYSLVVSGVGGNQYCATTLTNPQDDIESVTLGGASNLAQVAVGTTQALVVKTKGASPKKLSVFIDWNADSDFDDANEKVLTSETINGASNFTANIPVTTTVPIGSYSLMRVVCSEDINQTITACGTVAQGTSQDVLLSFVRPQTDLMITGLVSPTAQSFCSTPLKTNVSVSIKNNGLLPQSSIPLTVVVSNTSGTVATLTGTYKDTLATSDEANLSLDGTFDAVLGTTYTFTAFLKNDADQDQSNNKQVFTQTVTLPTAPTGSAVVCDGASALTVSGQTGNQLRWLDAPTNGTILLIGQSGTFTKPNNATAVYLMTDYTSGRLGQATKYELGGGTYYEFFDPKPIIETLSPIVIESARIYTGGAGKITVNLLKYPSLAPVSSMSFRVNQTRTTANTTRSSSQLVDDKTDLGIVVPLNIVLPEAGSYVLEQVCENGASLYRSNINLNSTASGSDIKSYPYSLNSTVNMTGALYGETVIKTGYYYFYDMKISSYHCPSAVATIPITTKALPSVNVSPINSSTVCPGTTQLFTATTNANYTYQWAKDGTAISGATTATYTASDAGKYTVTVQENKQCTATSTAASMNVYTVTTPTIAWNGGVITTPTAQKYQWSLNGNPISSGLTQTLVPASSGSYTVQVMDLNGCITPSSANFTITITATENEVVTDVITKVYPNPIAENIVLTYQTPKHPKIVKAELVNLLGAVIATKELDNQNDIYVGYFDATALTSGVFFVRITADDVTQLVKVVKN